MTLKWGIAGAGKISNEFTKAISTFPVDQHEVVAVGAQDLSRAQDFAKTHNIPVAYASYKSLAEDRDVDIAYVGNLNTQHLEVSKLMLENGKSVLCEKPLTINENQTRELIALAKKKKLFLMEAVWSRCFPAYAELRKQLDAGVIGEVQFVETSFGKQLSHVERLSSKELGGGTILDLGVYALQFQQFVFKGLYACDVVAVGHLNQHEVDESASAVITYIRGKTAVVNIHSCVELPNEAVIVGTLGTIKVPRFWCPDTIIMPTQTLHFPLPKTNTQFKNAYTVGLSYEVDEVGQCLKQGLLESNKITHDETIQLAKLMDKLRKDIGVVFPQDS